MPAPASTLPIPWFFVPTRTGVAISDQDVVAFQIARNARNFLTSPGTLFEAGQCYPMPRAVTLGEHMLGEGLLGAPVWAFSRNPILTLNAVVLLAYWIAAMAAYALVFHWTGSAEGALAAGLLYGFHPLRLQDPVHPFIIGNQWTVLALLFADRLFQRRRWLDAAGLGLCLSLQLLESFYTVLAMTLIGGVYGAYLVWAHRRTLVATLPRLLAALIPPAIVAGLVYAPYLATRHTWNALQDRGAILFLPQAYGFGGNAYPGTLLLALAAVALVDRLARRRAGDAPDPRLALAFAGFAVLWASVYFLPLPWVAWTVPSLWQLAQRIVPGMDAVRSGASLCIGVYLCWGLLAGFGVAVLCRRRSRVVRGAILVCVAALWSVETFAQGAATASFGRRTDLFAREVAPSDETRRLYQRIDAGAVADIPFVSDSIPGYLGLASRYVRPHAYHGRPVGSCNNSFLTPVQSQLAATLRRLPRRLPVLDALQGLGFRYLLVHMEEVPPAEQPDFAARVQRLERPQENHAYLLPVDSDGVRTLYRIAGALRADPEPGRLRFLAEGAKLVDGPSPTLSLQVENGADDAVFVHPQPLRPTPFLLRWYGAGGGPLGQEVVHELLPLSLAARDRQWMSFAVKPPPGAVEVALAYADRPDGVLLRVSPQRAGG